MFVIKLFNEKESNFEFKRTVESIKSYVLSKIYSENTTIISDNSSMEIIHGKENLPTSDEIVIELLVKKTIIINNEDLKDRSKLDRHLNMIRNFCDQAKNIEETQYLPINMRSKEEDK